MAEAIGIRELRQNLSGTLARVRDGERLVITDRNHPVAELVPVGRAGLERLIEEGRVTAPARPLKLAPVSLSGEPEPGTAALEYVRGE